MALILHMPMQDDAANATVDDISASNNDGTLSSGTTADFSVAGPGGNLPKALSVSGTLATLSSAVVLDIQATVQFWAKRNDKVDADEPFGDGIDTSYIRFGAGNDTVLWLDQGEIEVSCESGVDTADWHYYAIAAEIGGAIVLSVDGGVPLEFSGPSDTTFSTQVLFALFNDLLAGLRIYDEVRTQQQIQADMEADVPPVVSELISAVQPAIHSAIRSAINSSLSRRRRRLGT